MIYVVARPDGRTERVNGRRALFRHLERLGEADRAGVTVSAGTVRLAGDKVFATMSYARERDDDTTLPGVRTRDERGLALGDLPGVRSLGTGVAPDRVERGVERPEGGDYGTLSMALD